MDTIPNGSIICDIGDIIDMIYEIEFNNQIHNNYIKKFKDEIYLIK
jgi:hypothetical protein